MVSSLEADPRQGDRPAVSPAADGSFDARRIAVIVPCRNEAGTIGKVVSDFRAALPGADVIVVDNDSEDATEERARAAGARVIHESRPGKGYALVSGFQAATGADFYVMVDGDDTYPAEQVVELLAAAAAGADMVIGTRLGSAEEGAFRPGHGWGNRFFIFLVRAFLSIRTRDLFSGYRVLSRRFVEVSPLIAEGFEVEVELSMQARAHGFRVSELPVRYRARSAGSRSKLRTLRDGYRILLALLIFFRDYRPLTFFGILAAIFLALALMGGGVVIAEFVRTGLVNRLPLAVLSAALFILGALAFTCGVLLSSIKRRAAEIAALISSRSRPEGQRSSTAP